jgi:predicted DNA-binding transcriptional regulator AlpA
MIPPRFIRLRDAPEYLGMDRSVFNLTVRPTLTEVTIGRQGVAFDRLDLDAWADEYMRRNGRAGKGGSQKWRDEARPQESQPIVPFRSERQGSSRCTTTTRRMALYTWLPSATSERLDTVSIRHASMHG